MKYDYKTLSEAWSNPINRDLMMIFAFTLSLAVALVTAAIMVIGQL